VVGGVPGAMRYRMYGFVIIRRRIKGSCFKNGFIDSIRFDGRLRSGTPTVITREPLFSMLRSSRVRVDSMSWCRYRWELLVEFSSDIMRADELITPIINMSRVMGLY
jgi:hypothetical protein